MPNSLDKLHLAFRTEPGSTRHKINQTTRPFDLIPDEILSYILVLAAWSRSATRQYGFPIIPMLVSRRWYHATLSTPSLWNTIIINDRCMSQVSIRAKRSGAISLDVRVEVSESSDVCSYTDAVLSCIPRCCNMEIHVESGHSSVMSGVFSRVDAPRLHRLIVHSRVHAAVAPSCFSASGLHWEPWTSISSLVELNVDESFAAYIPADNITNFLRAATNLEILRIKAIEIVSSQTVITEVLEQPNRVRFPLPNLRSLSLEFLYLSETLALLAVFDFPNLRTLHLEPFGDEDIRDGLSFHPLWSMLRFPQLQNLSVRHRPGVKDQYWVSLFGNLPDTMLHLSIESVTQSVDREEPLAFVVLDSQLQKFRNHVKILTSDVVPFHSNVELMERWGGGTPAMKLRIPMQAIMDAIGFKPLERIRGEFIRLQELTTVEVFYEGSEGEGDLCFTNWDEMMVCWNVAPAGCV